MTAASSLSQIATTYLASSWQSFKAHRISQEPSCGSVVMNQYVSPNHKAFLLHWDTYICMCIFKDLWESLKVNSILVKYF